MIETAREAADPVDGPASEGDKSLVQARAKHGAAASIGAIAAILALTAFAFAAPDSAPVAAPVASATLAAFDADGVHRVLTARYVERARQSLAQADDLRKSGDTTRADKAERAAATWAAAAAALVRAADAEARATNVQLDMLDAGTRAERERALLEESLATVGRRKAELARLEREKNEAPTHTTQTADGKDSADGGAAHGSRGKGSAARDAKDAGSEKDWAPNAATAAP